MKVNLIIETKINEQGITQAELSRKINTSRQSLNQRLNRDSMRTNELIDILEVLNYDLVIQPKISQLSNGSYIIERGR